MTPAQFLELTLSLSLQATIVVLLTHGFCRMLDSARAESRLWTACYLVLLLMTAAALLMPHFRPLHPWRGVSSETAARVARIEKSAGQMVFAVWAVGAAVTTFLVARAWVRTTRFLKSCRPVGDPGTALAGLLMEPTGSSGREGSRQVRLLTSPRLGSPFCWQMHEPTIVLPEFLLDRSESELRFIIRHELEHLRIGHPLQLFLQRLIEVIYWFHPMLWWASQQSALVREFACDDAAATGRRDIAGYLRVLLAIAEQGGGAESAPKNVLAFGRGSSLMARRGRRLLALAQASGERRVADSGSTRLAVVLSAAAAGAAFIWCPIDVLASSRSDWSPWPTWTAEVLHTFDVPVRDFEPNDRRASLHELREASMPHAPDSVPLRSE